MVCECEKSDNPLCGFCKDDLYCPQCGQGITRVFSKYERRQNGADGPRSIWIYQNPSTGAFEFALSAVGYGERREEIRSYPRLDLDQSRLRDSEWFDRRLDEGEVSDDQESRTYALRNERRTGGVTADPGLSLRDVGEVLPLTICGPFHDQSFELRVCRAPEFAVTLTGSGILDAGSLTRTHWQVWKRAELRLQLTIEALTAPVCLASDLRIEAGAFPEGVASPPRLESPLVGGTEIWPGKPVSVDVVLDTRGWSAEQEFKFVLYLPLSGCDEFAQEHTLEMISAGNLRFNSDWLSISDELHFGEVSRLTDRKRSWTPVVVMNDGDQTVYVEQPEVVVKSGPSDYSWLRVEWADGLFPNQRRPLEPRQSAELALTVDLSRMTSADLPASDVLRAAIVFWDRQRDEPRQWDLTVVFNDVGERPAPDDEWLAIDFGSTNSYAAIKDANRRIVPLLAGGGTGGTTGMPGPAGLFGAAGTEGAEFGDEQFPTTIFFQDVSQRDRPRYLIGHEAEAAGVEFPSAVVHGMKRWIGVSERKKFRVRDPLRNEAEFTVEEAVLLYLREVIRRCEDNRRARVSKIGLSFPANFDHRRVARLNDIAQRLAANLSREVAALPIECDPPRIDEATAVTLGFMLDTDALPEKTKSLLQERGEVVIAAFDFGGGTIDTALIRIGSENPDPIDFAYFHSKYLGIGGDENFGGENVTLAFLELLRKRVLACLTKAAQGTNLVNLALPIDPPGQGHALLESRTNFDALWAAAEQLKMFQCRVAAGTSSMAETPSAGMSGDRDAQGGSVASDAAEADAAGDGAAGDAVPSGVESPRESPNSERSRLDAHLSVQLQRLSIEFDAASRREKCKLAEHETLQAALESAVSDGSLLVPLQEVYEHRIEHDFRGESNAKVLDRLRRCIEEVQRFRDRAAVEIDVVVLAGASSRLPIVERLWREAFPAASLEFDRLHPKSKVAAGLAHFLNLRGNQPERVERIACRTDYTAAPIGVLEPGQKKFFELIEACTDASDSERWFPPRGPLPLQGVWTTKPARTLRLFEKRTDGPRPFGSFDLTKPPLDAAAANGSTTGGSPPDVSSAPASMPSPLDGLSRRAVFHIRFAQGLQRIEMRVTDGDRIVGVWPMIPAESDDGARN